MIRIRRKLRDRFTAAKLRRRALKMARREENPPVRPRPLIGVEFIQRVAQYWHRPKPLKGWDRWLAAKAKKRAARERARLIAKHQPDWLP